MITVRSKSIVKILFAAAVLLLFAYVIIEKLYPESKEDKPLIIIAEADSVFINVMREFGIKNTWYSKKGDKYIVKLPPDVSAEMIILDISEKMKEKNVTIVSKETVKNQRAVMELYSGDEYFYSAEFSYDKNNSRENLNVAFILMDITELGENEMAELIKSTEKYALALTPSRANRWLADSLTSSGRNYVVLINGEIDELEYKIDDKFSDKKLITTFHTIVENFNDALFFILEDLSSQYSPRVNRILTEEFKRKKIKHFPLSEFSYINRNYTLGNNSEIMSGKHRIFCIDASDFIKMRNEIKMMRKRGTKVMSLSAVD